MGKNTFWRRALAVSLAAVCLIGTVAALTGDLNDDGKANSWDLQLAVNQGKTQEEKAAVLEGVLGGADQLKPNAEGVYEIYNTVGLYNMAKHASEGATFKLMNDIDMVGMNWKPVETFKGVFDGQGYTVSNVNITTCGEGSYMGFFATVDHNNDKTQAVVKNLNLRNVKITAAKNAEYIGLIAGQCRGIIQDCTVTGFVTDHRTNLSKNVYIGTVAGRLNASNPDGNVKFTANFNNFLTVNSGSVGEQNSGDNVNGITTKMGMDFAQLEEGSKTRTTGYVGVNGTTARMIDETGKVTWNWQDITNSTQLVSEELQQRRQIVAQHMYDMGTVYWTPNKDLRILWYRSGASDRSKTDYLTTNLYRGIPYNHGASGLERFNDWIYSEDLPADAFYITDRAIVQQFNDAFNNGTYTEINGKKVLSKITSNTGVSWTNPTYNYLPSDWTGTLKPGGAYITGFARYIGSDCSSAAVLAWRKINAATGSTGYMCATNTGDMFSSPKYTTAVGTSEYTGILPLGGVTFADPSDTSSTARGTLVNAFYDENPDQFLFALTQASMGDCLMGYKSAGGHTLMLMGDAVTIRDKSGKILPEVSYVITSEQGGGGSTGTRTSDGKKWESSWSVNKKYSYKELVRYGKESSINEYRYFPITCAALKQEDTPAATAWCKLEKGVIKSNFHIISTTVGDETVYTMTTFSGSRSACTSVTIAKTHTATTGTVTVLLANGETYDFEF